MTDEQLYFRSGAAIGYAMAIDAAFPGGNKVAEATSTIFGNLDLTAAQLLTLRAEINATVQG